MKILVCGDRNWSNKESIQKILEKCKDKCTLLIHGDARGADRLAGEIGIELRLIVLAVPAKWDKYKKAAGLIRNQEMLDMKPDLVIAFHSDIENSKGTKHMISIAKKAGIKVLLITK